MKNILLAYVIKTQTDDFGKEFSYSDVVQVFLADDYESPIHAADEALMNVELDLMHSQSIYTWNICEIINSSDY